MQHTVATHPTESRVFAPPAARTILNPGRPMLQRKCACGGTPGPTGECAECRKRRLDPLQRRASGPGPAEMPPIVREVLASPGQSLDLATRAFMEPRFGHDFSQVRIHADAQAAQSAGAVNALAYTVGSVVAFAAGQYQPGTHAGQRLLAHELTHVVQQAGSPQAASPASTASLEQDAQAAEATVTAGNPTRPRGRAVAQQLLRQVTTGTATPPPPRAPTPAEQTVINAARLGGFVRCQRAYQRTVGIGPPGPAGRVDAAEAWRMEARRLARIMFEWDDPNLEQVGEIVGAMRSFLTPGLQIVVGQPGDPECGSRAGYVRGLRQPIVLCPAFFSDGPEQQIRTLVHEAAHLARVASADLSEGYCVDFDCATSCGGFNSADSWGHYVHCLSGQAPDAPQVIVGTPGGTPAPTP